MNLLADESVDRQIVEGLRQAGYIVIYIAEIEPSITDQTVFDRANENKALLLTADKDFGEIVFRDGRLISDGVVLIRLSGLTSEKKSEIVVDVIREHKENLYRHFSVISAGKIRFTSKK